MYECLVAVDNLADAENLTAAEEEELKKRVQAQRRRNEEERQINENAKLAEEYIRSLKSKEKKNFDERCFVFRNVEKLDEVIKNEEVDVTDKQEQEQEQEPENEKEIEPEAECLTKEVVVEPDDEERPIARFEYSHIINHQYFVFVFSPRRMSELNIVEKVKLIPPYSSLFIFSHTNK